MSATRWYFMNGQSKFTTLNFSDSIWNSPQFIRSCVAQWTDKKSSFFDHILEAPLSHGHISTNLTWFQSARTDRKAAPRPTVRAALLVAPLLLLDFRGFAPNNTTKNQNFYLHAIRKRRLGKAPPFVGRFFIGFGRSDRKMCKKTQIFQISSKFHRLNRRKAGIFTCMRSARVDWGKSHRQFIKFSRGLRFRAKICIFSTRNHAKIILFDFFRSFRVMAPAATPQKYKNNTKYASDRGPFTARHNYAFPRTIPLCLWIAFFEQMRGIGCPFMK